MANCDFDGIRPACPNRANNAQPAGQPSHDLAAMARQVKTRQPLLQTDGSIGDRPDDHLPIFHRDAHPLVGAQMSIRDLRSYVTCV